jgi:ribosomal protein S18 acetylase RimI-like enzyme
MAQPNISEHAVEIEQGLSFVQFSPLLAPHFEHINRLWIEDMFQLEEIDKHVLQNPQKYIIDKGGYIYFARHPRLGVVGACALLNSGNGNFELTKMGVLPSARGLKVGEKLLQFVLAQAHAIPSNLLYLLTNKKCEAAIHLYEKNGFEHSDEIMQRYGKNYARCDVAMVYASVS